MSSRVDDETDVLVAGAGPAGAVAAHQLARRGLRVMLVERAKLPREKVCGCTLNLHALEALDRAGLGGVIPRAVESGEAQTLQAAEVRTPRQSATFELPGGVAMKRSVLDSAIVDAARESGVELEDETTASLGSNDGSGEENHRRVKLRGPAGERTVRARVFISATGLGGVELAERPGANSLPKRIGPPKRIGASRIFLEAPVDYSAGTVYMACGADGYVGLVRLGDGSLVAACALAPRATRARGGIGPVAAALIAQARLPEIPGLEDGHWSGTSLFPAASSSLGSRRAFAIGDAASFVEPFTGQGIGWAIESALAVVPLVVLGARGWSEKLATDWEHIHRRVVQRRQRDCWRIAWLLRGAARREVAMALLSRWPAAGRALARRLSQ